MPRYDKTSFRGPAAPDSTGPQAGLAVVATPVDLTVHRQAGQNALALASGLAGLVPALTQFGDRRKKEQDRLDTIAGQRDRQAQPDNTLPTTLREQSEAYQSGFMKQHGLMSGIEDSVSIEAEYNVAKDRPDFNLDTFLADHRRDLLKGMTDPDAYEAYTTHLTRTESKLRDDFAKKSLLDLRRKEGEDLAGEMAATQQEMRGRTPEAQIATYSNMVTKFNGLRGLPREVVTGMWVNSLVSDDTTFPQDYDHLYYKDASGTAPADRLDANGKPYRAVIDDARRKAQVRADKATEALMDAGDREFALQHKQVLLYDPMSIKDPAEYVRQNARIWKSPDQVGAALGEILKAQDTWRENDFYQRAASGSLPFSHALATDPKFIKAAEARHMARWANVNWADANSITALLKESTDDFVRHGVADPFIKSVADRITGMSMQPDGKGGTTLSPEFRGMHTLWKSARDNKTQALGLFKDDALAFMQVFDDWPGTEAEKFAAAQQATNSKFKQNQKLIGADERASLRKTVISDLDSWRKEGVTTWASPANADMFADTIIDQANILRSRGGNMTMKQAVSVIMSKSEATHAWDGHGQFVKIPADLPKEKATAYLKQYVDEIKAIHATRGTPLENFVLVSKMVNGKPGFGMTDMLGTEIAPPQTQEMLEYSSLRAKNALPAQVTAGQNQRMDERAAYALQNQAIGQMSPEESSAGSLAPEVAAEVGKLRKERMQQEQRDSAAFLLSIGQLSPEEFNGRMLEIEKEEAASRDTQVKAATEAAKKVPVLPKADTATPSTNVPVQQPVGPEQTPKEIAQARAHTDPSTALTAVMEGFGNKKYRDPNGKDWCIGYGYNLSKRSPEQVVSDLVQAGVTDQQRVKDIIAGTGTITPDEGARLSKMVRKNSVRIAEQALGSATWQQLADHKRAVLIDLAYQTGDYSDSFMSALRNLARGSEAGVKQALQVSFYNSQTRERKMDIRRNEHRLAMWESPDRFLQLVNQGK